MLWLTKFCVPSTRLDSLNGLLNYVFTNADSVGGKRKFNAVTVMSPEFIAFQMINNIIKASLAVGQTGLRDNRCIVRLVN